MNKNVPHIEFDKKRKIYYVNVGQLNYSELTEFLANFRKNLQRYDRTEIAKEMDPVLRLMKKIGYEV